MSAQDSESDRRHQGVKPQQIVNSKEQLEFIVNNSLDALYQQNLQDDKYEYISPAIQKILSFSVDEMMEMDSISLAQHIHHDDLEVVAREIELTNSGKKEHSLISYRFLTKTGEHRWVADHFRLIRDDLGWPLYRIGVIRDITERVQIEERLAYSEKNYRELVESANSVILRWAKDGRIIFMNGYGLSLFGYNRENLIGKHVRILLPEKSTSSLNNLVEEITTKPEKYRNHVNENITRDGRILWMNWTNKPLYENDQLIEILAIGSDVTKLREAQESLSRYAGVQKAINKILQVTLTDKNKEELGFVCLSVCEEITESKFSFIGEKCDDELHDIAVHSLGWDAYKRIEGHHRFRVPIAYAPVLKTGKSLISNDPAPYLAKIDMPPGHPPIHAFLAVPLIRDGEVTGLIAVANRVDGYTEKQIEALETIAPAITEAFRRKEAEEEIKRAREELELRVQERTEELKIACENLRAGIKQREEIEERLRQSQKMEAIGTLAGGIAHDFNNILGGIIGFAEMMEETPPPQTKEAQQIKRILTAALRGRDLVQRILAFSRKTNLKKERLHLSTIIEDTVQLLRPSLPSTIQIKIKYHAGHDLVLASSVELQQIIMNLATNAGFSMREKGGVLHIATYNVHTTQENAQNYGHEVEPGDYIQLSMSNTGTGMSPEIRNRIFEPFFSTKQTGEGTGMGLSVVYGIVKDLKGSISVTSEPGEGSTFDILIPTVDSSEELLQNGTEPEVRGGPEHILFVDDEELLAEWGEQALKRLGYEVTSFTNPLTALNAFQSDPSAFDLAIVDQTMPNLSGHNLSREMLKVRAGFPIILCTGHADVVTDAEVKKTGIKEILIKPLRKQTLAEVIRRVLVQKENKRSGEKKE